MKTKCLRLLIAPLIFVTLVGVSGYGVFIGAATSPNAMLRRWSLAAKASGVT